jgi:hypothetical protein
VEDSRSGAHDFPAPVAHIARSTQRVEASAGGRKFRAHGELALARGFACRINIEDQIPPA